MTARDIAEAYTNSYDPRLAGPELTDYIAAVIEAFAPTEEKEAA